MKQILRVAAAILLMLSCAPVSAALRSLEASDKAQWKTIGETTLSVDGRWLVYQETHTARGGAMSVVVRSTQGDTERRYAAAPGAFALSPSGRRLAFLAENTSVLAVELATGRTLRLQGASKFAFSAAPAEWMATESHATPGSGSFDLTLTDLSSSREPDRAELLAGATDYAFDPKGKRIAWTDGSGLHVRDLASRAVSVLLPSAASVTYRDLTWSPTGDSLAVLRASAPDVHELVVISTVQRARPSVKVFDPRTWKGFPEGHTLCPASPAAYIVGRQSSLIWRDDERGLFFDVCPAAEPRAAAERAGGPIVWRSGDPELPGARQLRRTPGAQARFLSFVALGNGRFIQLADRGVSEVKPRTSGSHLLGWGWRGYGWTNDVEFDTRGRQKRDYWLIELATGKRTSVARGLELQVVSFVRVNLAAELSADGAFVVYKAGRDYMSYEIRTGARRNLTAKLPAKFYAEINRLDDVTSFNSSAALTDVLQGWTSDGRGMLLSDYYDIWLVPLDGGPARNLTSDGREKGLTYSLARLRRSYGWAAEMGEKPAVDLRQPVYLQAVELDTRRMALARRTPEGQIQTLRWDDASMSYFQAGDVRVYSRETAISPLNYYVADGEWKTVRQLTDTNPQQRELQWIPPPRFLTYKTPQGATLHAVLYLPFGYTDGKNYPTIVEIYEYRSGSLHNYVDPNVHSHPESVFGWLQRGYAVLSPDILPRVGAPGRAAVESVEAAVDAAVATGLVNRDRMALFGHSFGGYETSFIVSKSKSFRAAVSYAGASNLWSNCGSAYGNVIPASFLCENGQTNVGGPWWTHWNAYLDNSPLYHAEGIDTPLLLVHGDSDTAVPFLQSVELFNTLRRMGKTQVVLLQYPGEDHSLGDSALPDLDRRLTDFFGHFLQDGPVPDWWLHDSSVSH